MANQLPQFEITDDLGLTIQYDGTVGTSAVPIPSNADKTISEVIIQNDPANTKGAEVYVSFDGGTKFWTILWNEAFPWEPRNALKQIYIKAKDAATKYQIIINYEP